MSPYFSLSYSQQLTESPSPFARIYSGFICTACPWNLNSSHSKPFHQSFFDPQFSSFICYCSPVKLICLPSLYLMVSFLIFGGWFSLPEMFSSLHQFPPTVFKNSTQCYFSKPPWRLPWATISAPCLLSTSSCLQTQLLRSVPCHVCAISKTDMLIWSQEFGFAFFSVNCSQ